MSTDEIEIDVAGERDAKALTEPLVVRDDVGIARDAPGLFVVFSATNNRYLVDVVGSACECWDDRLDSRPDCKHKRRVEFELAIRELPEWARLEAIDEHFGAFLDNARDPALELD